MVTLQELLREKELVELLLDLVKYRQAHGREKLKEAISELNAVLQLRKTLDANPEALLGEK